MLTVPIKNCIFARLSCQAKRAKSFTYFNKYRHIIEAAVFHLQAQCWLLQELVRYYRLNDFAPTLKSIEEHMAAKGQVSPEVTVMQQLVKTRFYCRIKACISYVSICT